MFYKDADDDDFKKINLYEIPCINIDDGVTENHIVDVHNRVEKCFSLVKNGIDEHKPTTSITELVDEGLQFMSTNYFFNLKFKFNEELFCFIASLPINEIDVDFSTKMVDALCILLENDDFMLSFYVENGHFDFLINSIKENSVLLLNMDSVYNILILINSRYNILNDKELIDVLIAHAYEIKQPRLFDFLSLINPDTCDEEIPKNIEETIQRIFASNETRYTLLRSCIKTIENYAEKGYFLVSLFKSFTLLLQRSGNAMLKNELFSCIAKLASNGYFYEEVNAKSLLLSLNENSSKRLKNSLFIALTALLDSETIRGKFIRTGCLDVISENVLEYADFDTKKHILLLSAKIFDTCLPEQFTKIPQDIIAEICDMMSIVEEERIISIALHSICSLIKASPIEYKPELAELINDSIDSDFLNDAMEEDSNESAQFIFEFLKTHSLV